MRPRAGLVLVMLLLGAGLALSFPLGLGVWLVAAGFLFWAAGTPCHERFLPDSKPVDVPAARLFPPRDPGCRVPRR